MTYRNLYNKCKMVEELKEDYNKFIDDYGLLCNDFVNVCKENTKLKAEIEQLKAELEKLEIARNKQIDVLLQEIEQLKESINKISMFENELYSEKQVAVDCEYAYMELAIDNQLNAVSRIKLMMKH